MTIPSDPGASIQDDNTTYILNQGATGLATRFSNLYNMFNAGIGHDNMVLSDSFDWTGIHTFSSTKLHLLSSGAAFDLIFAVTTAFTEDRTLTIDIGDANRTATLGGNLTTAAAFTTSGANALTLTTTGATDVTLPTTGTLATLAGAETLSSKTLTAPKFVDGGFIADANGSELLIFGTTASAVNEVKLTNAATGNDPVLEASGETNVGFTIQGKGTGIVKVKAVRAEYVDKGDQSSGTVTFDWTGGNTQSVRLTGNITIAFSNPTDSQKFTLIIAQDTTGSRTVTWPTSIRWLNGTGATDSTTDKPTLTTTASKVDIFSFTYNSTLGIYWGTVVGFKGAIT